MNFDNDYPQYKVSASNLNGSVVFFVSLPTGDFVLPAADMAAAIQAMMASLTANGYTAAASYETLTRTAV